LASLLLGLFFKSCLELLGFRKFFCAQEKIPDLVFQGAGNLLKQVTILGDREQVLFQVLEAIYLEEGVEELPSGSLGKLQFATELALLAVQDVPEELGRVSPPVQA
jgi:hypothetical protein